MTNGPISAILLGAGTSLVLLSLAVPRWITGRGEWSEQQAIQLQQASQNYHAALHALVHKHAGKDAHDTKLDAVRREYEHQNALLEAARSRGRTAAQVLRWAGVLGCIAGLLVYIVHMVASAKQ